MVDMKRPDAQRGAALLVGLIILMAAMAAGLMTLFGQRLSETRRVVHDANVLAEAKSALIAYSIANDLSSPSLGNKRPGSLPCPDNWPRNSASVGRASLNCAGNALGRLPWRDLGLSDLRDSAGERLWYAVSDRFRRTNPILTAGGINPDTFGRITLRASDGVSFLASAGSPTGAAAVIIAPGAAIRRLNGLMQNRTSANYNVPRHYLDCMGAGCATEDNANFVNGSNINGFVAGPVKSGELSVVNDRILPLSASELMVTVNRAVARAVLAELNRSLQNNGFLPMPADIGDVNCLGRLTIPSTPPPGRCVPGTGAFGRLPASPPSPYWGISGTFLDGDATANWFQSNSWREHVFYAVTPACTVSPLCTAGVLQVNNPPYAVVNNAKVVVMVGGVAIASQSRTVKTVESNYLEDENLSWADSVFTKRLPVGSSAPFNDVVEVLQ
jgi:hypothetical protein